MKISGTIPSIGSAPDGGRSLPANGAGAAAQRPAASGDAQVALSPRLQEIEARVAAAPVVNAERVAEIKQAIAEGRFKVNPERIADGLLSSVRQMLAKDR